jgi:hypothetical protein
VDPQPKWARLDIMKRGVVYIPKVQGFLDWLSNHNLARGPGTVEQVWHIYGPLISSTYPSLVYHNFTHSPPSKYTH